MSVDFAALATAMVSGVSDVRACLIVSRDGLVLGAHPASEEEKALAAWSRVAALGEVERGFVALRDEVWAFCRRGPYAALSSGHPSTRPGILLDALEQMLLAAEESRVRKDVLRSSQERDAAAADALRGPRTPLHPGSREEPAQPAPAEVSAAVSLEGNSFSAWVERLRAQAMQAKAEPEAAVALPPLSRGQPVPQASVEPEVSPVADAGSQNGEVHAADEHGAEHRSVDTAALSREFAGLLSEGLADREDR
jgi:hypothetical protein